MPDQNQQTQQVDQNLQNQQMSQPASQKQVSEPMKEKKSKVEQKLNKKNTKKIKKKRKGFVWLKDTVLAVVNITFIIILIYLLQQMPSKAKEINSLRSTSITSKSVGTGEVQFFDLDTNKEKIEALTGVFPDEDKLLQFVAAIEEIRDTGSVVGFTFGSENPVLDKTKNLGLPIRIDLRGSWEEISRDIERIQKLPYLFRPVTFDAQELPQEGYVEVKYGGFLYVDKSLEKN